MESVSPKEMAAIMVTSVKNTVKQQWPAFYSILNEHFFAIYDCELKDTELGQYYLIFLMLGIELEILAKKTSKNTSDAVKKEILNLFEPTDLKLTIEAEISEFQGTYKDGKTKSSNNPNYPVFEDCIVKLLNLWYKKDINKLKLLKYDVVNPYVTGIVGAAVMNLIKLDKINIQDYSISFE